MNITELTSRTPKYIHKSLNVLLIIFTSIFAVIAFFAIQDILIAIAAFIVARTSSEPWVTVRDNYVVITVRNLWVFVGGILLLILFVVNLDYHARQIGNARSTKILLWTLLLELFFIGLSALV